MRFSYLFALTIAFGLTAAVAQAADRSTAGAFQIAQISSSPPPAEHSPSAPTSAGGAFRECVDCPQMVSIPAGAFTMGSPASEPGRFDSEGPQHVVNLHAFAAGLYDVTRQEYATFVRETGYASSVNCKAYNGKDMQHAPGKDWHDPGFAQSERDPVVCVSWKDAQAYIAWLNDKVSHGHTGKGPYRLLSEAEWEYAARAGTTTPFYWGDQISRSDANYGPDELRFAPMSKGADRWDYTSPSGAFPANGFGLFDMAGEVWQFTEDCWHDNYDGAPTDGTAWIAGDCANRVVRGGSWYKPPAGERSAKRGKGTPDDLLNSQEIGFRVARSLD